MSYTVWHAEDHAVQHAELMLLEDVASGAYALETFDADDLTNARQIIERYADLNISLADASIVVLAERFRCQDVLTLDGHFQALHANGRPLRLLPD